MCRGAKIFFRQFVMVSKKGFRKKCALFVFVFFMLEKEKRKHEKWKKQISKKAQKNSVFGVVVKKNVFFCKIVIF